MSGNRLSCLLACVLGALSPFVTVAGGDDASLTVDHVVTLLKAEIPEPVILSRIRAHGKPFALNAEELKRLKAAGASEQVMLLMIDPSSAAASGPGADPGAGTPAAARVFIYRYKQSQGGALEPSVYCDDKELARMDNGRYFIAKLPPGDHTLRSNDKQAGIRLKVEPGQDYYVRVELAAGFWKGHGRLVLVAKEQGAFEVQKLQPLGPDKVRDQERVQTGRGLSH